MTQRQSCSTLNNGENHGIFQKDGSQTSRIGVDDQLEPTERTPLIPGEEERPMVARRLGKGKQVSFETTPPEQGQQTDTLLHSDFIGLKLENTGSVARDHLASERTFLAYVRTSLSVACAGVALTQILSITEFLSENAYDTATTSATLTYSQSQQVEAYARPLGVTAVLLALLILGIGVVRYFSIQKTLVTGRFPVARAGVALVAILFGSLVAATLAVLVHGWYQQQKQQNQS